MPNLNSGDRNCVVSSRWRFGIPEVRREVVPPAGIEPATHGFPLLLPATPSSLRLPIRRRTAAGGEQELVPSSAWARKASPGSWTAALPPTSSATSSSPTANSFSGVRAP